MGALTNYVCMENLMAINNSINNFMYVQQFDFN